MTSTNYGKIAVLSPVVFENAETDGILKACGKCVSFTTVLATLSVLTLCEMVDHFKMGNGYTCKRILHISMAARLRMQMKVPDGHHAMYTYRITDQIPLICGH